MPRLPNSASPATTPARAPKFAPTSTTTSAQTATPSSTWTPTPGSAPPSALLDSQEVLRGQRAVGISHNGLLYRLQTTRQGKLILTK